MDASMNVNHNHLTNAQNEQQYDTEQDEFEY